MPKIRRTLKPVMDAVAGLASAPRAQSGMAHADQASRGDDKAGSARLSGLADLPARLGVTQAVAKTITFRIIVTTLDFTSNYIVIGELTTAAGLSAFALVAGPAFYLTHEMLWNYYGGPDKDAPVRVSFRRAAETPGEEPRGFTMSRAIAKTITFRTVATVMDFGATYVATADLATAAGLTAFGFVVGPFVYLGHEKVWDYYTHNRGSVDDAVKLLPPPRQEVLAPV
jgi:uncharacterized membrane protein